MLTVFELCVVLFKSVPPNLLFRSIFFQGLLRPSALYRGQCMQSERAHCWSEPCCTLLENDSDGTWRP